jgi:hypothetical protein
LKGQSSLTAPSIGDRTCPLAVHKVRGQLS